MACARSRLGASPRCSNNLSSLIFIGVAMPHKQVTSNQCKAVFA